MQFRSNRSDVVAVAARASALTLVLVLAGCANIDADTSQAWFAKPLDVAGRNAGGYTFSELAESKQHRRPITPNDLVAANGSCPPPAAPAAAPAAPGAQPPSPPPDPASLLGGPIALGMSECDVVFRAGQPSSVQLGQLPNGDRTAVLTFNSGPRAGIYRFERGALMELNSVAQSAPPPQQPVKKKAAKSTKPAKKNDQS